MLPSGPPARLCTIEQPARSLRDAAADGAATALGKISPDGAEEPPGGPPTIHRLSPKAPKNQMFRLGIALALMVV